MERKHSTEIQTELSFKVSQQLLEETIHPLAAWSLIRSPRSAVAYPS